VDERVVVEFTDVGALGGDDFVGVHAFVRYEATAGDGRPLRAMYNRVTWVLVRREAGWRIAHEHTSAPIDFESFKPIVER
jgi:ketosteroid isomerase-like protein